MRQKRKTETFSIWVAGSFDTATKLTVYVLHICEESKESLEAISHSIADALCKFNLDMEHVVAYIADNATAKYEKNCSVFQKLRLLQPNMIKANWHCHQKWRNERLEPKRENLAEGM